MDILPAGGPHATVRALAKARDARSIVLVEGFSDQLALEALAALHGRRLDAEGIAVVPVGGAQAVRRHLELFGPHGRAVAVAGLVDAREEPVFRLALERAGFGVVPTRAALERLGFFVCVDDLEDELIRAHGAGGVEGVLAANGDLDAFRTFQKQPAWRGRPVEQQLRRFMGSADRRKLRYARLLVESLDDARMPQPLVDVLGRL